jgi:hypothetical protein
MEGPDWFRKREGPILGPALAEQHWESVPKDGLHPCGWELVHLAAQRAARRIVPGAEGCVVRPAIR